MPKMESKDPEAITVSTRYFNDRLDREIYRLSRSRVHRLQKLAEFLVEYRDTGRRISAPRERRGPGFASAWIDDDVFDPKVPAKI